MKKVFVEKKISQKFLRTRLCFRFITGFFENGVFKKLWFGVAVFRSTRVAFPAGLGVAHPNFFNFFSFLKKLAKIGVTHPVSRCQMPPSGSKQPTPNPKLFFDVREPSDILNRSSDQMLPVCCSIFDSLGRAFEGFHFLGAPLKWCPQKNENPLKLPKSSKM